MPEANESECYVDRPGLGLFLKARIAAVAAIAFAFLARSAAESDWRTAPLLLVVLGGVAVVLGVGIWIVWMSRTRYTLSERVLDLEWGWLHQTVPLRDIVKIRRRAFRWHPFLSHPGYATRGFDLIEIADRRGYHLFISPRDVAAFERELRSRVQAAGGLSS